MRLLRFIFRRNSKDVAKDRLKLLLISDRTDCSAEMLEMIKNDIIQVISKYMEIDTEVKEKIGDELLSKYQLAEAEVTHRWGVAVFAHTLRLGRSFLLEVLKA